MLIMAQYVWLGLLLLFLIVEFLTVGLASIWFAGGALIAMLLAAAGADTIWQIAVFLVVSTLLLLFTRPFAVRFINNKKEKTNYEGVIGKVVRVTGRVDNFHQSGSANVGGQEWTARSEKDAIVLEEGSLARVVRIQGVTLILTPYQEQEKEEEKA